MGKYSHRMQHLGIDFCCLNESVVFCFFLLFSELVYALADLVHSFDAFISKGKNPVILGGAITVARDFCVFSF